MIIEINDMMNIAFANGITPFASANNIPNKLKMNVLSDTVALQHILYSTKNFIE